MRVHRTLLVAALTLGGSGASASVVGASAPLTPVNQLSGACNMTNPNAAYGMFTVSQFHANPNGWDAGMGTAINNSNGGNVPPNENCGIPSSPPPRP